MAGSGFSPHVKSNTDKLYTRYGLPFLRSDEPTEASSMGKHKDGYEDILEERRHTSDFAFAFRSQPNVPRYKYNKERDPNQIKQHVLHSDRVQYRIEMIATDTGISKQDLYDEAAFILDEMSHNHSMKVLRSFCFFLTKVLKSVFQRIYVNEEGAQKLRQVQKEYPVILMPTHRSYLDFLLVSYIFYQYELTLPVIAAIMDFNGMLFFGWLLRNCGAFYIRRNFGSNLLYWAVFTEYVQTQLRNGDYPIEFFIEGTRSRTGKSYTPKIGMLSAALESYFKAEVPDVMIVPISISYERILEESVYAYELLGIPKPKESASGVFKARKILNEDFGSVHFHIGEAISVRQFTTGKINRVFHGLEPRYINNLSDEEKKVTTQLAYTIVRQQQQHLIISPWALVATVMLQGVTATGNNADITSMTNSTGTLTPIPIRQLIREVEWLKRLAHNFGAYVDWPGNASSESVLRYYLKLHANICHLTEDNTIAINTVTKTQAAATGQSHTFVNAATTIMLVSYRHNIMHVFIRPAIVAMCINGYSINNPSQETLSIEALYERYAFLEKLLSHDFVFQPGDTKSDFDHAVQSLSHCGGICVNDGLVWLKKSTTKHTLFLSNMIEPFLLGYWVLCQYLLSIPIDATGRSLAKKPKPLAYEAQRMVFTLVEDGTLKHTEVLSMDMLNNAMISLVNMKAIFRDKRVDEPYLSPNHAVLAKVSDDIATYLEIPMECVSRLTKARFTAKL